MHEPYDFPEVEDDDLTPASCRTQRPPHEQPAELNGLYVGHVGPEDGGPHNLATYRDPVPGEAEHVYVVVGVAEGEDTLRLDPPPLAQEAEGRRLRAFQTADLDVVRQAARNEEPPVEGRPCRLEPALYIVGAVHDHELRRLFCTFPEPIRR